MTWGRAVRSTARILATRIPEPASCGAGLEPERGFEPLTYHLRGGCSARLSYSGGVASVPAPSGRWRTRPRPAGTPGPSAVGSRSADRDELIRLGIALVVEEVGPRLEGDRQGPGLSRLDAKQAPEQICRLWILIAALEPPVERRLDLLGLQRLVEQSPHLKRMSLPLST